MSATDTITNLAQQPLTQVSLTRITALCLAVPALLITPYLLFCEHGITDCVVVANLVSIVVALKTSDPLTLLPVLGITSGLIGYNLYHSLIANTETNANTQKKPIKNRHTLHYKLRHISSSTNPQGKPVLGIWTAIF